MSEEALIRAFAASMVEPDAPAAVQADVRGFFVRHGVAPEAAAGLSELAAARLNVYRTMVHSRLRRAVSEYLPKTAARLGRARMQREIARFIADKAPSVPYFWRVTGEFLQWATGCGALPEELLELAAHEWSEAEVQNEVAGGEAASGRPLALDEPVQFDGTVTLRRYRWAVHRAPEAGPLEREATALLLHRDRVDHRVKTLELTPRAAAVTARLLAGDTLQAALTAACAELEVPLDDEFLTAMAGYFADLADRGALLGAAP